MYSEHTNDKDDNSKSKKSTHRVNRPRSPAVELSRSAVLAVNPPIRPFPQECLSIADDTKNTKADEKVEESCDDHEA